jgi:Uncharacterized ABC-type transport system, periplasmic component/surface lipoprotein
MKKISLLLALIMVLAVVFSGCGPSDSEESASTKPSESATDSASTETTEAAGTDVKVGFIYIGPANDGGFSTSHDVGRQALEAQLGVTTVYKELVPEGAEVESTIDDMVDQGCNVIVGCTYGYMPYFTAKAEEYPDVYFLHCSGDQSNGENYINFFGRIEQARYLTGIAAGLATTSNQIGYVAAFAIPEVVRGIDAFALGVASVNPAATVEVVWTSDWVDATIAKEAANTLISKGCDVITQHVDATSPQTAAEENSLYCVGYHMDSATVAPNASIASAVWNWSPYYVAVIRSIIDGTWTGENYWGGMEDGVVDIVLTDKAPAEAQAKINEAKEKILGGWCIFTGPITDNAGNVAVADGVAMTDEEMLSMMWFNENVIDNLE